ncbi:choline/carnitine/betaine transport [Saccharopolyspora lacisalsi]|uniref:Choline/carnitine/betaine transport n=1 Tax=Halosaccharopolyspora lacisalsi TaxID=1000566 RepID=A0A839DU25_9PSEU|nr:BCCT family transporter [Halosaccharopolyspora lacisalsi]MBA8824994.1 choline/carnitine/betaine transport [Halosaccharopolyspora lacisalsi]
MKRGEQEPRDRASHALTAPLRKRSIDPTVFGWSFGIVVVFCIVAAAIPGVIGDLASVGLTWVVGNLGWAFVLAAVGFVVFSLYLACSRYGGIPLSQDGEPPEYSTVSWVAMMFSAGMGIGLIFFGVYEPVAHLTDPAPWVDAAPGSQEAARQGMAYSFFHWGLHPWAIYSVVALALAYSTYRKGRGNLISSPFQALLGKKRIEDDGWGKPIDIWAIVATKFGGATSLGLGALQIAAGISLFTGIGGGFGQQGGGGTLMALLVIAVLIVFAVISALSGVSRGIKWLSNTTLVIAALLVAFILVAGPTVFLLNLAPSALGSYVFHFIPWSLHSPAFGGVSWLSDWTIFYWAWWISWTPFVSTFIARISKGRTVREFVLGVLIVPTLVSALWFTVLGGAGLNLQLTGRANIAGAGAGGEAAAFFTALEQYPGFVVVGIVVMFLVAIFWITGADSSAVVLGMLSSRGHTEPNKWLIAGWAVLSAIVAAVLLLVGGLDALQTFTILVAAPFVLIIMGLCWALYADLRRDPMRQARAGPVGRQRRPTLVPSEPEEGQEYEPDGEQEMRVPDRGGGDQSQR